MLLSPCVSVIMPVYNVEKYVKKSIQSVISQTIESFELIIVNDGSTDNSGAICDEFSHLDNVRVVHIKNGGLSNARNTGARLATGKYLYYCDSDDWIESNMLEKMVECAEENQAEIVLCGFHMEYYEGGKKLDYKVYEKNAVYTKEEFQKNFYKLLKKNLLNTAWNKLFLRQYVVDKNVRYRNMLCEDVYYNLHLFKDISKICVLDFAPYHWFRSRVGSETGKFCNADFLWSTRKKLYETLLNLTKYWKIKDEKFINDINCYYCDRLVQCVQVIMEDKELSLKEKKQQIKLIIEDKLSIEAIHNAKSESKIMNICYKPIKYKNITLSCFMGFGISFIKRKFAVVFYNIRAKEVHEAK